jgi:hemoglobin-like flavoprotein
VVEALPAEEQEAIKLLLKDLFPKLGSAYGGSGYGAGWLSPWAKTKRICSPDYCSRYFSYSVPTSDVRDSEMDALYAKATKEPVAAVHKDVAAYFTGGKAKRVIERMRQEEKRMPPDAVPSLCVAIAANAKHIPNPPSLFNFAEPISQAGILISHLIGRLPPGEQRVALTKQVIESADPLWFGSEVLRWLCVTDDADKADSNTLTKEQYEEVGKILVERIKAYANSGQPLFSIDVPQEQSLLFEWQRVDGREPVQAHLSAVFSSDFENITIFLQAITGFSWSLDNGIPHVADLRIEQLEIIKLIYDLDSLASLIQAHIIGDFANPQYYPDSDTPIGQRLAEQFIYAYKILKNDGELRDTGVDTDDIQNKILAADPEPENG